MWEGTITLYFKCLKCGKAQSQLAHPPEVGPFKDCPYCGGEIEFEPSCWSCEELEGGYCDVVCENGNAYRQRKVKT